MAEEESYATLKNRRWRQNNPDKALAITLKHDHGLSLDQYRGLLEACGGRCPVCNTEFDRSNWMASPRVDHCHKTGRIRGLLCHRCNVAEGHLKTPENIMRLYEYVTSNPDDQIKPCYIPRTSLKNIPTVKQDLRRSRGR